MARISDWKPPNSYRDAVTHLIEGYITINRTKGNNLSRDLKFVSAKLAASEDHDISLLKEYDLKAHESKEASVAACLQVLDTCYSQRIYPRGRCDLGRTIRFRQSSEHEQDSGRLFGHNSDWRG